MVPHSMNMNLLNSNNFNAAASIYNNYKTTTTSTTHYNSTICKLAEDLINKIGNNTYYTYNESQDFNRWVDKLELYQTMIGIDSTSLTVNDDNYLYFKKTLHEQHGKYIKFSHYFAFDKLEMAKNWLKSCEDQHKNTNVLNPLNSAENINLSSDSIYQSENAKTNLKPIAESKKKIEMLKRMQDRISTNLINALITRDYIENKPKASFVNTIHIRFMEIFGL